MTNQKKEWPSRRDFLHRAALLSGVVTVSSTTISCSQEDDPSNRIWRLNPAFRIKEMAKGEIELYTFKGDGQKLQFNFKHLEADFFRGLEKEFDFESMLSLIAQKNAITKESCRRTLKRSVKEFAKAGLIYSGDKMLVKITGAKNG